MKTAVILATGPSMSQAIADYALKRADLVIAVSDAYKLAPKAHALVSSDDAWWGAHPEALEFEGEKYSVRMPGTQHEQSLGTGSNSGLLAMLIAQKKGADRILLCGFDMHGTHYFGPHPEGLKNTTPHRFDVFKTQFERWKPKGLQILNCTPNSALRCYPFADLKEQLEGFVTC
jgi:hypothetical protein